MQTTLLTALAALAVLTLVLLPRQVHAQPEPGAEGEDAPVNPLDLIEEANEAARKSRFKEAVPKYKEALQAAPDSFPSVYYNLAEIRRFQNNCAEAILLYNRYLALSPTTPDRKAVEKSIHQCEKVIGATATFTVNATGPESATISLNDIPVASGRTFSAPLPPGRWEVAVTAPDWETHRAAITLPPEGGTFDVALKQQTFFGELAVIVNLEGAQILVDHKPVGASPLKSIKLDAGKHHLEVQKPGYHPWVRNVIIPRDDINTVSVNLEKLDQP